MNQFNPLIHHRKSIRLKGYDYSKAGLYFITICCQNRTCLFGNVVGANPCGRPNTNNNPCGRPNTETQMVLNDAGNMIEEQWLLLKNRFSNIELHEFVVMPNHFHGILEIVDTNENIVDLNDIGRPQGHEQGNEQPQGHENGNGQPRGHAPTTVGDIIGAFKSITTVEYIRGVKTFDWEPFNGKLWQRNYYEHIIRDENAYQIISNYIINNPLEWHKDKFFVQQQISNYTSMNNLEIIEIKSEQLEQYKAFLNLGLINDKDNFRISANDDINAPFPTKDTVDSFTLGAFSNKQLAGIVSFMRDGIDREKLRHKGIMFRMYVSKDFRGQGIAKKLIEKLIERVKTIPDIEQINLTVISNNDNAKLLYVKFGFVTFGTEVNAIKWKGKYFNEDQMKLTL